MKQRDPRLQYELLGARGRAATEAKELDARNDAGADAPRSEGYRQPPGRGAADSVRVVGTMVCTRHKHHSRGHVVLCPYCEHERVLKRFPPMAATQLPEPTASGRAGSVHVTQRFDLRGESNDV